MGCSGLAVSYPAQPAPSAGEELLCCSQRIRGATGFLQDPSKEPFRYCKMPVTSLGGSSWLILKAYTPLVLKWA